MDPSAFVAPIDTAARPAAPVSTPDPSLFVAPIAAVSQQPAMSLMDPSAFVAPIDTAARLAASAPASTPNPSSFVAPIAVAPQRTPETSPFSIPTITSLETGQYYLQLIAYNRPEQVESAVSGIGRAYPLAIQSAGTRESPIYRLLVWPVNLGESGALLQRFKGLGYRDAFIRQGS
jgi:hypothetical protein